MEQLTEWHIRIEKDIKEILIQTTRTNGRVDGIEDKIETHDEHITNLLADRSETKGRDKVVWVVLGMVGAVALVIIGWYLNKK